MLVTDLDPSDPAYAFLLEMRGLVAQQESLLRETQNLGAARIAAAVLSALPRAIEWATTITAALVLVVVAAASAWGGYQWRGNSPPVIGIRAGADRCHAEGQGWQVCWIPVRIPPKEGQ